MAVILSHDTLYTFPPPPGEGPAEWPGTPLGEGNTITRTKGRTRLHDKTVDARPGRREELLNTVIRHMVEQNGKQTLWLHDVVIHGVRVRAITNSQHLIDFWTDNWYSASEWEAVTGRPPARQPQVTVYALAGVAGEAEAAYYSRSSNTIVFFNTSYYGQLKSWVLGAVGRVLAEEYGIHSIHGACVEKDGKGVLYIAPTGTGKSTSSYGLVGFPNTRFHSDDWVYVRYAYTTRDGRLVHPVRIQHKRGVARGYQCFAWLEKHPDKEALLTGLTLDDREVQLHAGDLDFRRPRQAYAYTSEKVFYLRTNLVENFPLAIAEMLHSKLENVPDVTPEFMARHAGLIDMLADLVLNAGYEGVRGYIAASDAQAIRQALARMIAFDNARAMLDITRVLPAERVFTNPLDGAHLTSVFLLKRDFSDPIVAERLSLDQFMERLLIGQTPDGKREVAYNAYRAVDDAAEKTAIEAAEAAAHSSGAPLYQTMRTQGWGVQTLEQEFELFRVMYGACACYDLNTIIQKDPSVKDKKEAVSRTISIIARIVDSAPRSLRQTIGDYHLLLPHYAP